MEKSTDLFLLLDGAKLDAPRITYQHDDAPWADWLYRRTRHEPALDASPYLVRPSAGSRLWVNQSNWVENGIVLRTKATPEDLIEHLRSLISVRMPSGQLSYCRFYSNTRLHHLLHALTETERNVFSGPITEWRNLSAKAPWQSITTEGKAEARSSEDEGWFQLTEDHIDALDRAQAESFLAKLARHLGLDTKPDSFGQVERLAHQAQSHGFRSEKDIARYSELALRHQQKLDTDACIAILRASGTTNFQKLNQLDHLLAYGGA